MKPLQTPLNKAPNQGKRKNPNKNPSVSQKSKTQRFWKRTNYVSEPKPVARSICKRCFVFLLKLLFSENNIIIVVAAKVLW
jgi:hypothetical protein